MKNEDKILELLSDYIARSDRFEQEVKKRFENNDKKFETTQKEIVELRRDLRKSLVQQDAVLQEIFSISKRVGDLEDNH